MEETEGDREGRGDVEEGEGDGDGVGKPVLVGGEKRTMVTKQGYFRSLSSYIYLYRSHVLLSHVRYS